MTSITIKHKEVKVSLAVDTIDIEKLKEIITTTIQIINYNEKNM